MAFVLWISKDKTCHLSPGMVLGSQGRKLSQRCFAWSHFSCKLEVVSIRNKKVGYYNRKPDRYFSPYNLSISRSGEDHCAVFTSKQGQNRRRLSKTSAGGAGVACNSQCFSKRGKKNGRKKMQFQKKPRDSASLLKCGFDLRCHSVNRGEKKKAEFPLWTSDMLSPKTHCSKPIAIR